jgi:NNP family nitrate/nitrite transporter-like MFS transporter
MSTPKQAAETPHEAPGAVRVLVLSTVSFTLMFAVWLMFGVLSVPIQEEFGLTDSQVAWILAVAILNGSIWRLFLGVLADRVGGKLVTVAMLALTAIPAFLIAHVSLTYGLLLFFAFLIGFAGNLFSVGIAWNAAWFSRRNQGFALGVFGAGNVGASLTKFIGPAIITATAGSVYLGGLIPGGWRFIPALYAFLLVGMAAVVLFVAPKHDRKPGSDRPVGEMFRPLKYVRVWRFSLYYVVVFGAYVALASVLPKYYVDVYGLELQQAALLTALFIFPASLLRPLGGWISDRIGARRLMYFTFGLMLTALLFLAAPFGYIVLQTPTGTRDVLPYSLGVGWFTFLIFLVGVAMGIGKAAVYKHIPEYFPHDVGAVGGLVGMLGALGGFLLPPLFVAARDWTGLPQATFMVLFVLTLIAAIWMHVTVVRMLHNASPELRDRFEHDGPVEASLAAPETTPADHSAETALESTGAPR